MYTLDIKAYKTMLEIHDETKTPLYVYGPPGIGKSAIPRQVFKAVAEKENRQFIEWNDMTEQNKADCMRNPDKYFVFTDFRLGQCDTTDLRGIPNMTNADVLEYMPLAWVKYYAQPTARGVIFFDELNLAPPVVAGQAYQIINDRVVSDIRLSDGVFIFGAGNRAKDKAHVFTMPFPLRDRFSELELTINDEEWCNWAWKNEINPHLIAFIKWKPENLYNPGKGTEDKGSTPRGVVRASKLIESVNLPINDPIVHALTSCALGESFSVQFHAYTEIASKIDLDNLMANPESVKEFDSPDKWFAVCGIMGDRVRKLKTGDKTTTSKLFAIVHELPTEYAVVALNMIRVAFDSNPKFRSALSRYPRFKEMIADAAKYVLL